VNCSDVSIYKSDFDYFHVTKFDFDTLMRCFLTWLFSLNQFIKTYFSSTDCQLCQLQFTNTLNTIANVNKTVVQRILVIT
jgi:hypothetical protein